MKECDWQLVQLFFLVSIANYGLSFFGNNVLSNTCYIFSAIKLLVLLQSSCYNHKVYSRLFSWSPIFEMFSLIRKEKITWENCGTQTAKNNIVRHKKEFSSGSVTCPSCTNFSTNFRDEVKHYIAKEHSEATARVVHNCKICDQVCHSFHNLREHNGREHGAQRGSGAEKCWFWTTNERCWRQKPERRTRNVQTLFGGQWDGEGITQSLQLCRGHSGPEILVEKS